MSIRSHSIRSSLAAMSLLLFMADASHAVDGVMEINHVCATTTGCFTGDNAGYPVEISAAGSYRLTGDLTPAVGQDAINVDTADVTIDLNGFRLVGSGGGTGISADAADYLTVRNGTVRSFDLGLEVGAHPRLENLNIYGCTYEGVIVGGAGGFLRGNQVVDNGDVGLTLGATAAFGDNVVSGNSPDVSGGIPLAANHCADGSCSARPRLRRYYLTAVAYNATVADLPTICESGFHFGSVWEIFDPSQVEYDPTLGYNDPDPGEIGPDQMPGWTRGGPANCSDWNSTAPIDQGSTLRLDPNPGDSATVISPWEIINQTCAAPARVFCVED